MAELRVIAFAMLAGCAPMADAGPTATTATSGLAPPAGWIALPSLATAAIATIAADRITIDGSEAWGEPARGCYAAWIAVHGGGAAADVMASQLLAGLRTELAGIGLRDLVQPAAGADHGTLSFAFDRASYHGRVRAQLSNDGKVAALACFWNQREPAACAAACTPFLGSLR